ncbi:MAG: hypothetical protein ACI93R_000816 [Flavobacteriales bacterium]|jgi:hypothetical protein
MGIPPLVITVYQKTLSVLFTIVIAIVIAIVFTLFKRLRSLPRRIGKYLVGVFCAIHALWLSLASKPIRVLLVILVIGYISYGVVKRLVKPNLVEESIYQVHYLNEGWTDEERQMFYYTPQGTELLGLEYDWFVNLELPLSHNLLASEDTMRGWGFIVDPAQHASALNLGNLPVGMSRHIDPVNGKEKLDLGCAMCHTGELHYKGNALRIDGGQSLQSISTAKRGEFIVTLGASVFETLLNPAKWSRFAGRVVGDDNYAREKLKSDLWVYANGMKHFMTGAGASKYYPVEEGRGRTDAVGRIANIVFGYDLDEPDNYRVADAPASYPYLWDIWRFDWVQYTGFTNQAMARNIGESLGVLAPIKLVDESGALIRGDDFAETLISIDGMHCVEDILRKLKPPKWPENILGDIDIPKARDGKQLFVDKCVSCHGPHESEPYNWPVANSGRSNPANQIDVNWQWDMAGDIIEDDGKFYRKDWRESIWAMPWLDVSEIGTDATLAENYVDTKYDATKIIPNSKPVNAGDGLQVLLNRLVPTLYKRWQVEPSETANYDGLNIPFRIVNKKAYKARPLHGVWATPPFLHNGSVPTIYDLLSNENERPAQFYVGNREYNPDLLGYETSKSEGSFYHDASIKGNHNTGHYFSDKSVVGRIGKRLSEYEKFSLIEYIKVMGNPEFTKSLDGDPLNWDQYSTAPEDSTAQEACINVHSQSSTIAEKES